MIPCLFCKFKSAPLLISKVIISYCLFIIAIIKAVSPSSFLKFKSTPLLISKAEAVWSLFTIDQNKADTSLLLSCTISSMLIGSVEYLSGADINEYDGGLILLVEYVSGTDINDFDEDLPLLCA